MDPRFLALTLEQIETEYWAFQYQEGKVGEEIEDEEYDQEAILAEYERQAEEAAAAKPLATVPKNDEWEEVKF